MEDEIKSEQRHQQLYIYEPPFKKSSIRPWRGGIGFGQGNRGYLLFLGEYQIYFIECVENIRIFMSAQHE